MINKDKWINSLPQQKNFHDIENKLDHERWTDTLPKKNHYNSAKKYTAMVALIICSLFFVSLVKNETRKLQKELYALQVSINKTQFNLDQALLDNAVITSPENISLLAKEHLDYDLEFYKKTQIKKLDSKNVKVIKASTEKNNKIKNIQASIKSQVTKKINEKKVEITRFKKMYSDPKTLPDTVKKQVASKIIAKKEEIKKIYSEPKQILTLERAGKWSAVQLVKVFLGMPVIPGK